MNRKTGKQNKARKCLFFYVYIFENNSVHLPATKATFWIPHMATTPFVEPHFYVFFCYFFARFSFDVLLVLSAKCNSIKVS